MIAVAIFLAASAVPRSLLNAADAAAMAQTQCMFATFRAASQAHLSPVDFDSRVRRDCSSQSRQLSRVSARIFALRGDADAAARAERLVEESYRRMAEEYRQFPAKEKMIRDFCSERPADCR